MAWWQQSGVLALFEFPLPLESSLFQGTVQFTSVTVTM